MTTIIGVRMDPASYDESARRVMEWTRAQESRYVCAANVHMLMEAWDSSVYRKIINSGDLIVPDGMPLVWLMRLKGERGQTRIYGPDLMLHVLAAASSERVAVGFYGGAPDVLTALVEQMRMRFPDLNVAFAYSPPFRELTEEEDGRIVEQINASGAQVLFVGLGCPRQETWMAAHRGRIQSVMLGVGAAFDFHAGVKAQAPTWMQRSGLEWLFRLLTEPRRLWRRYLWHNPRFVILAILDFLGILR